MGGKRVSRRTRRKAATPVQCVAGGVALTFLGGLALLQIALPHHESTFALHTKSANPLRGRRLATLKRKTIPVEEPGECVQGVNGSDFGVTASGKWGIKKPMVIEQPLFPCAEFNDEKGACCNNVFANEIGMSYDHMFDVAGTGKGTPRTQECLFKARAKYKELNEYFCLACNPKQVAFMSCCDQMSTNTTKCLGNETLYGQTKPSGQKCTNRDVNTIRLCKNYADAAWDKQRNPMTGEDFPPGEMYDQCGMLMWEGEDSKKGGLGILDWGAVNGESGDAPVVPSAAWGSFEEYVRDVKPPLFDEFAVMIVPDEEGNCFAGKQYNSAGRAVVQISTLMAVSIASALFLL